MQCLSVRLSVCLSVRQWVTFVDHVKTNKHIFEIFSPPGSHTTLVFPYQTGCRYSDGNPPNEGVECKGVWKNHDFRPMSCFISQMMQVRAQLLWKLSNGTGLNDLHWPVTQISRSWYHSTSNNSKTVADRLWWRTNRKSYVIYRTAPFFNDLEQPLTQFLKSRYPLTLNIS